jgi:putative tryptophan/tyrosine transport system substrate-binding protein
MTVRRHEFITLLGGAAASTSSWPLAARAQQGERVRRIAVALQYSESDPEAQANIAAFRRRLEDLGWSEGRNVRFDTRWGAGDIRRRRAIATEVVALAPDLILAASAVYVELLQELTRSIPIVFVGTIDPVGGGLVASLARPGGNTTGFTSIEYTIGGKWLQLLKEVAPNVTRVAVFRATTLPGAGQFGAIQGASALLGVEVSPVAARDAGEFEQAITGFARGPNGGLIVTVGVGVAGVQNDTIIALAARHRLPAVFSNRSFVTAGGLLSYGPVTTDQYIQAAGYVDRILKGEKPGDLPVQQPTRYETVLNRKTAKALGIEVPTSILLRADEVIE